MHVLGQHLLKPLSFAASARTSPLPCCRWWNVKPSSDGSTGLPSCSFGPLLNFFGLWGSPGTGKGGRRLLAAEAQAAAASGTAAVGSGRVGLTSLAAGPARGASRVQAAAADDGGGRVMAMAESWCTREGWWVEQLSSGKSVWPPDLHRAQVEARRAGRMR